MRAGVLLSDVVPDELEDYAHDGERPARYCRTKCCKLCCRRWAGLTSWRRSGHNTIHRYTWSPKRGLRRTSADLTLAGQAWCEPVRTRPAWCRRATLRRPVSGYVFHLQTNRRTAKLRVVQEPISSKATPTNSEGVSFVAHLLHGFEFD